MDFTPILKPLSSLFRSSSLNPKSSIPFTVMLLSPHPDDECIVGSLPLRLARENGARVVNVAVTLGSKVERRAERRRELEAACEFLEFELLELDQEERKRTGELRSLIQKYQPDLILAPHKMDLHPTHIKTGELLRKVLPGIKKLNVLVAWTEFWAPMKKPNIIVEVPTELVELQMRALELHAGEVSRNPYHLRLPAWMMDNVRRGSELIKGKGEAAADFPFGVLYQLQHFTGGRFRQPRVPPLLTDRTDIGQIFRLILEAASESRTKVK